MAKSHISIGLLFFGLFLLTGAYMLMNFPELYRGREEVRMMYRATHIYLLMACLLNLVLGYYLNELRSHTHILLRRTASVLVLMCPALFLGAFFIESPEFLIERPITFWTVIILVAGVFLHGVAAFLDARRKS